jgi:hypothetical protein
LILSLVNTGTGYVRQHDDKNKGAQERRRAVDDAAAGVRVHPPLRRCGQDVLLRPRPRPEGAVERPVSGHRRADLFLVTVFQDAVLHHLGRAIWHATQQTRTLHTRSHLPYTHRTNTHHVTCTPRRNSESNPDCLSSPHFPELAKRKSSGLRPPWRRRWPSRWWRRCSPRRRTPRARCGWRCRSRGPSAYRRRSSPTWWCSPSRLANLPSPLCSSPPPGAVFRLVCMG